MKMVKATLSNLNTSIYLNPMYIKYVYRTGSGDTCIKTIDPPESEKESPGNSFLVRETPDEIAEQFEDNFQVVNMRKVTDIDPASLH